MSSYSIIQFLVAKGEVHGQITEVLATVGEKIAEFAKIAKSHVKHRIVATVYS